MAWFKRDKTALTIQEDKLDLPDGLWIKCPSCNEVLYKKELEKNLYVCMKCDYHFRINSDDYIRILADDREFQEFNANIQSTDPLKFKDSKRYSERLKQAIATTNLTEAIRTGFCNIHAIPVVLGIMDFRFIGGSMGSVVGEKFSRAANKAIEKKYPLVVISASGGARMQESAFSLMQMAKTSAHLALLAQAGLPFISVLTHPTTGGVTASFSMLGDIIIAEPKALIGFAGPRVIKQTIGQDLPEGFQKSEFLLQHGFVDAIVHRKELKEKLFQMLSFFQVEQTTAVQAV